MKKIILLFILMINFSIFAENQEIIEGGIVKYDNHSHVVGLFASKEEAIQIFEARVEYFAKEYKIIISEEFLDENGKGKIAILFHKENEDIQCFVMLEGNKIIYGNMIPSGDCAIIKKYLN
ncbi:hypothetical protein [Fusobacterium sp.]|uniref:hypothetical protein n=1 Tax=Fusobacterium sp. TaxID=68766 RepID=UPI0028FDE726|nr:hypothetical protein [Fusobacterium sp.]MDU1911484.1 hypothetical protein [Fusobacterium sp.]